ncbi:MAG: alanine racemase [Peptostreptococcaceae bacterium]|nr:alanine racemase [Peptostreptococcaceae bacterium]
MRAAWAETDLGAIRKNIKYLMSKIKPETLFMGVVKADGYGHGAVQVAKVLIEEGTSHFGVAIVEEGVELRNADITEPILILGRTFDEDYPMLIQHRLMPTVFTMDQAEAMNTFAEKNNAIITIHIKIDTGMGRLGFLLEDGLLEKIEKIVNMKHLHVEGIFSHLGTAPQISTPEYCFEQFKRFTTLLQQLEIQGINIPIRHLSNSAATILYPEMQFDMVRPGTSIYGLYAGPELESLNEKLSPGMMVKSKLAHIKPCPIGTRVSYDSSFIASRPSVLGVVPMGYVDGVFRNLANRGEVLVHGKRCPMVGNVCMDQFVIDLTEIDDPMVGDEVVLIGKQGEASISAEEAGRKAGTISIEVLCGLGKRMPQVFKD